ncbi:MAG: hypothetical protein KTR17_10965 [Cellvibrionaceae bacterium]|nr:hypothetical protein [Cellvibrionaceae bacterium]
MNLSFLTNKHFVVALIVSPILAVVAWFAVDKIVTPAPVVAEGGASYPLVAKSNCRYSSGKCALTNGDIKILLLKVQDPVSGQVKLDMDCNLGCNFARLELLDKQRQSLLSLVFDGHSRASLAPLAAELSRAKIMRFVAGLEGSVYYVETSTAFLN